MNYSRYLCVALAISLSSASLFAGELAVTKPVVTVVPNKAKVEPKLYTENALNILLTPDQSEFTLKLKSNPSTGFSWFLREYDANLLQPIKHYYQNGEGSLIGSAGYEFWVFHVKPSAFVVPQQTLLRMVYSQPWQGDNSTQLVYRISTGTKGNAKP